MLKKLLLINLLVTQIAFANFKILDLEQVRVGYKNFIFARDPMFWDSTPKEQININIETSLMKYGFWNSFVHGTTDESQYKRIGLQMELGVRISNSLEVSYKHHSQHMLDCTYPYQRFPVEDSVGVYLYLFRKDKKESIF